MGDPGLEGVNGSKMLCRNWELAIGIGNEEGGSNEELGGWDVKKD